MMSNGGPGISLPPEKRWKFYVQNGTFWGKIALCFYSKQSAILTQTFGHETVL